VALSRLSFTVVLLWNGFVAVGPPGVANPKQFLQTSNGMSNELLNLNAKESHSLRASQAAGRKRIIMIFHTAIVVCLVSFEPAMRGWVQEF
jgi:hypothetical protein